MDKHVLVRKGKWLLVPPAGNRLQYIAVPLCKYVAGRETFLVLNYYHHYSY
jgi:hypothetical protein